MVDNIEIFVSYDREDERWRLKLGKHLKLLERQGLAVIWHDRKIEAGDEWKGQIHHHLGICHIVLLLVSANFMASDYCNDIEVQCALERHHMQSARVIPIILSPTDLNGAPFSELQPLPQDRKPLLRSTRYATENAFCAVAESIRIVVNEMRAHPLLNVSLSQSDVDSKILYDILLRLNYRDQVKLFKKVIENESHSGAFLIRGQAEYGQRWLLNRLIRLVPGYGPGKPPFKFNFQRQIGSRGLDALWRELARWANLANPVHPSPLKIVERVYKLWQSQTIVLTLDDLDRSNAQSINQFMAEFWEPLMNLVQSKPSFSPRRHLLLFLVDDAGCTDTWDVPGIECFDRTWKPHMLVKLKQLGEISANDMHSWIETEDRLPSRFTDPDVIPDILDNSCGGIPQLAFEHICHLCGHDWYEREAEWVKQYG